MSYRHRERHQQGNVGWRRASVLGANDGIVSTSSLLVGVVAWHAAHQNILVTSVASLVAGTMLMATGEYVSVQSQTDTEQTALVKEKIELRDDAHSEHQELTAIFVSRGINFPLALQAAEHLMAQDALGAHARDELGITDTLSAHPLYAAFASALSFAVGAMLPLLVVLLASVAQLIIFILLASLCFLGMLGGFAAKVGGADVVRGIVRVTF